MDASQFINNDIQVDNKIQPNNFDKALVEYAVNSQFQNEPIYAVNDTQIKAYQSFKVSDVYQGSMISVSPVSDFLSDQINTNKTTYVLKEGGERYMSGKTYCMYYTEILVPEREPVFNS